VALVRTDVLEEPGASETSVLKRDTRHNIPEDTILLLRALIYNDWSSCNLKMTSINYEQMEKNNVKHSEANRFTI
jgi:hypothetical protein